jgi:hypothetical protein
VISRHLPPGDVPFPFDFGSRGFFTAASGVRAACNGTPRRKVTGSKQPLPGTTYTANRPSALAPFSELVDITLNTKMLGGIFPQANNASRSFSETS